MSNLERGIQSLVNQEKRDQKIFRDYKKRNWTHSVVPGGGGAGAAPEACDLSTGEIIVAGTIASGAVIALWELGKKIVK